MAHYRSLNILYSTGCYTKVLSLSEIQDFFFFFFNTSYSVSSLCQIHCIIGKITVLLNAGPKQMVIAKYFCI